MTAIFTRGFVLATTATLFHSFGNGLISSTVALMIVQRLGLSTELIGLTLGVSAVAAVLARAPLGPAIDRYGARRFGMTGPLFVGSGALLFGIAQRGQPGAAFAVDLPLVVPLAAVVWGLGISTFSTASTTYLANTIPVERRAEGMGYFGMGIDARADRAQLSGHALLAPGCSGGGIRPHRTRQGLGRAPGPVRPRRAQRVATRAHRLHAQPGFRGGRSQGCRNSLLVSRCRAVDV